MRALRPEDFATYFSSIHGCDPFPWQLRLAKTVIDTGRWPRLLDLPTSSGKTATIDIALFHLAYEADLGHARRAPLRILFVVDRRIVVDSAYDRALKIAQAIRDAKDGVLSVVADRLRLLSGEGVPPVDVVRLRGGVPQDRDWARSPAHPLIAISTVDQVGSRLLFRGYGVSPRMWPVHAGLVGSDALWLLDEVHLSRPLEKTLDTITSWHENSGCGRTARYRRLAPFGVVKLSATPGEKVTDVFKLSADDLKHPVLKPRLSAEKLTVIEEAKGSLADAVAGHAMRLAGLVPSDQQRSPKSKQSTPMLEPVHRVGVVVNSIRLAREVHKRTASAVGERAEVLLLTGRVRPLDRVAIMRRLEPLFADRSRPEPDKPMILVATQAIEVGADLDVEALVTEIAPLDSLRQRFGRLDRLGLLGRTSAVVIHPPGQPSKGASKAATPWTPIMRIYGESAYKTLRWLKSFRSKVDFGIEAMNEKLKTLGSEKSQQLLASRSEAPSLFSPYSDLWAMTSPAPLATPEPSLFLHGSEKSMADVMVVWRSDVDPNDLQGSKMILDSCPPSALEALPVPLWSFRRWLQGKPESADVADVPEGEPEAVNTGSELVLCWADEEWSARRVDEITPGSLVVVPAHLGGCDEWGWNPLEKSEVVDLGTEANYRQRLRGALHLTENTIRNALMRTAETEPRSMSREIWHDLLRMVEDMGEELDAEAVRARLMAHEQLPDTWRRLLAGMQGRGLSLSICDSMSSDRHLILVASRRLEEGLLDSEPPEAGSGCDAITVSENSSFAERQVLLTDHLCHVEQHARMFAVRAGLDQHMRNLIGLAARLHDVGKADLRFQADLRGIGALAGYDSSVVASLIPPDAFLAKSSAKTASAAAISRRARTQATPPGFRHEALSVAMSHGHPEVANLCEQDRDLVLWLIGTHHGYGRPFFPPCLYGTPGQVASFKIDDAVLASEACNAPIRLDQGWLELASRVLQRYGPWECARLEAILRLADHAASANEGYSGRTGSTVSNKKEGLL